MMDPVDETGVPSDSHRPRPLEIADSNGTSIVQHPSSTATAVVAANNHNNNNNNPSSAAIILPSSNGISSGLATSTSGINRISMSARRGSAQTMVAMSPPHSPSFHVGSGSLARNTSMRLSRPSSFFSTNTRAFSGSFGTNAFDSTEFHQYLGDLRHSPQAVVDELGHGDENLQQDTQAQNNNNGSANRNNISKIEEKPEEAKKPKKIKNFFRKIKAKLCCRADTVVVPVNVPIQRQLTHTSGPMTSRFDVTSANGSDKIMPFQSNNHPNSSNFSNNFDYYGGGGGGGNSRLQIDLENSNLPGTVLRKVVNDDNNNNLGYGTPPLSVEKRSDDQELLEAMLSQYEEYNAEEYVVLKQLYKSYASHVHLAVSRATNQNVVLKFLKAHTKVQHEIRALKAVQGMVGTVQLLNVLKTQSEIVLVLQEVKAKSRHYCPDNLLALKRYIRQLLDILARVHSIGIIHRDIKESNALMSDRVIVIDFGLAVIGDCCSGIAGTKGYIAPELHMKNGIGTNKIDVFSSGVVFTQMIFGIHLRGLKDAQSLRLCESKESCITWIKQRFIGWEKVERVNILFDDGVWNLIRQMLSFHPEDRPSCVEALSHSCLAAERTSPTSEPTVLQQDWSQN